ncbi:hypothetical protein EBB07_15435 [Paenibacillaceae bacterium]|nr:hypothetical protein EBB07_15435 [Paenibacillaceae bacterium]
MTYSISRVGHRGWMDVQEKLLPETFLRKRIFIEALDKDNQVISKILVTESDKDSMLAVLFAKYGPIILIQELYQGLFSEDELDTALLLLEQYELIPTHDNIMELKSLFEKHGHQKVKLAHDMSKNYSSWGDGYFMVTPKSPYFRISFSFEDALNFINEREGFYFAIDKQGNRRYDFVDEPTKNQISYQQRKNGNQVVFLSFTDWKLQRV